MKTLRSTSIYFNFCKRWWSGGTLSREPKKLDFYYSFQIVKYKHRKNCECQKSEMFSKIWKFSELYHVTQLDQHITQYIALFTEKYHKNLALECTVLVHMLQYRAHCLIYVELLHEAASDPISRPETQPSIPRINPKVSLSIPDNKTHVF